MDFVPTDLKTMAYIESEAEFQRAKMKGFWLKMLRRITGGNTCPLPFAKASEWLSTTQAVDLGLQDVPLKDFVGSMGRHHDFTHNFLPCFGNRGGKERWREVYTLAVTGAGFPPVEAYKIGTTYYLKDGHHRVSVARHLGWRSIQANVVELYPV